MSFPESRGVSEATEQEGSRQGYGAAPSFHEPTRSTESPRAQTPPDTAQQAERPGPRTSVCVTHTGLICLVREAHFNSTNTHQAPALQKSPELYR